MIKNIYNLFLLSPTFSTKTPGHVEAGACHTKLMQLRSMRPNPPYFAKRLRMAGYLFLKYALRSFMRSRVKTDLIKPCEAQPTPLVSDDVRMQSRRHISIKYYVLIFALSTLTLQATNDQFTIMIDPAGDAKHTGRLIGDTLERGISLQCAEQLKTALSQAFKNIRVILTRVPGETIQPLQNASFANRLGIDLYISLYFYHEPHTAAYVSLYHYLENPVTDFWHQPINLSFYQVNQAHLLNLKTTQAWGKIILETLHDKRCSKFFKPRGLFGIPFTPLIGIKAPAIAVEVGLKNKQDWQHIIDPLVIAIERIMA